VQQKAVRTQQFDQIETQPVGALYRCRMGVANARQPDLVECFRRRPTIVERYVGWRYRRPGTGVRWKWAAALP
jgi:hypothetical protein